MVMVDEYIRSFGELEMILSTDDGRLYASVTLDGLGLAVSSIPICEWWKDSDRISAESMLMDITFSEAMRFLASRVHEDMEV